MSSKKSSQNHKKQQSVGSTSNQRPHHSKSKGNTEDHNKDNKAGNSNITITRLQNVDTIAVPDMCLFCFEVLDHELNNMKEPAPPKFTNEAYPLFVTWKTGGDMQLRGCIGTFRPIHLHDGLREYALTSALKDSRFDPISKDELRTLTVSVSILHSFEETHGHLNWTLGVHGIRIEFLTDSGCKSTATFLPHIPTEQGWDKIQTIDSLLRKGGYRAAITPQVRRSIKLTRYRSQVIEMDYKAYHNKLLERRAVRRRVKR